MKSQNNMYWDLGLCAIRTLHEGNFGVLSQSIRFLVDEFSNHIVGLSCEFGGTCRRAEGKTGSTSAGHVIINDWLGHRCFQNRLLANTKMILNSLLQVPEASPAFLDFTHSYA